MAHPRTPGSNDSSLASSSSYVRELEVATALALRAGALIRAEFHREGGPRSDGVSHADVDVEAEAVIDDGLRAAFPDDAYYGEERGGRGPRAARRRWLVDPNDGTRAFIAGHRGSAVSVALVVDDVPVLGVVYAPTAPDDGGDLVTWAEGGPLTRNGRVVERVALPTRLDGMAVVAVNGDAELRHVGRALAAVAPARILSRPSIAYRLALVAVGDADAAISWSGPTDYDVAGGHALLRGVGGELVDARGKPYRYGAGATGPSDVFGGHVDVTRELAQRKDAAPVVIATSSLDALFPRRAPGHGKRVADAAVLSRAHGALLGQVAGDALGQLVEFASREQVARKYPGGVRELVDGGVWNTLAGQPTDDSELALVLARSIVAAGGFDDDAVLAGYRAWLQSGPFDVGSTTRRGIGGGDTSDSQANGSLMRVSPLAVHLWRNEPDAVTTVVVRDSALTHESEVCLAAVAVWSSAVALAVREGPTPAVLYARVASWVRTRDDFPASVREIFAGDDVAPVKDFMTNQGWVLVALRNAFHQLLHARSFEEGVVQTVSQGGDTDTNGAIAGALLGAVYGREAVPARFRRVVLTCRATRGAHPRPPALWADDLLELAERLVATGPLHPVYDEEDDGDDGVVALADRRRRNETEDAARAALRGAAKDAIAALMPLRTAALSLAVVRGLRVSGSSEQGTNAWIEQALVNARDIDVVAVGDALAALRRIVEAGEKE